MLVWAHVWRLFRSAMLFGGVVCFEIRTPWFALRYVDVKSTVFLRWAVMVASWKETSNFFVPGAKRLFHDVYIQTGREPELLGDCRREVDLVAAGVRHRAAADGAGREAGCRVAERDDQLARLQGRQGRVPGRRRRNGDERRGDEHREKTFHNNPPKWTSGLGKGANVPRSGIKL